MVRKSGFPGMKVLEFAFSADGQSIYLPYHYDENCVVYTGTHDNDTIQGWYEAMPEWDRDFSIRYLGNRHTPRKEIHWDFIRAALGSRARLAVIPMQDYLGLGSEARINEPSTLATTGNGGFCRMNLTGNWRRPAGIWPGSTADSDRANRRKCGAERLIRQTKSPGADLAGSCPRAFSEGGNYSSASSSSVLVSSSVSAWKASVSFSCSPARMVVSVPSILFRTSSPSSRWVEKVT